MNMRLLPGIRSGLLVAVALLLASCGGRPTIMPTPTLSIVVFATKEPPSPEPSPTATEAPTATPEISDELQTSDDMLAENRPANVNPLTGLRVDDPATLQRRPIMVRIGNDPEARPQVALSEADIVYEELVEWWVTRFTAVFLTHAPEVIGPIRSARLINVLLTPQYQAALANSGGSDGVRWEISQSDIVNLDEFFVPGPYFYRPNEGWQTRLAFDAQAGRDYLADEDLEQDVDLRGFSFSEQLNTDNLPADAVVEANEVIIPYPQLTSETTWTYDSSSGKYLRFVTGKPFLDANGTQISAANVVIYFADHQETDIVEDSTGATSIRIMVNGQGTTWLLRDGKLLKGNWETNGRETPKFTFDDGRPMLFKPGNSWVEIVPLEYEIKVDGRSQQLAEDSAAPDATDEPAVDEAVVEETVEPTPTSTSTPIGARPSGQ